MSCKNKNIKRYLDLPFVEHRIFPLYRLYQKMNAKMPCVACQRASCTKSLPIISISTYFLLPLVFQIQNQCKQCTKSFTSTSSSILTLSSVPSKRAKMHSALFQHLADCRCYISHIMSMMKDWVKHRTLYIIRIMYGLRIPVYSGIFFLSSC